MADTWFERALPILIAVSDADASGRDLDQAATGALPELPRSDYPRTVEALSDAGYLEARLNRGDGQLLGARVIKLLERGRRETQQWPSESLAETLLQILDRQIEEEADPATKSRLQKLRDAAGQLGIGVLGEVLVALGRSGLSAWGG